MNILVTGGAGYIGSHTCVAAYAAGHTITILDNLSNSSPESLNRVEKISGRRPRLVVGDIGDRSVVRSVLDSERFDAVIHFAGYKAVGESVAKPWEYYQNNVAGTLVLLDELRRHGVRNFIFSSSATVYGNPDPKDLPLKETAPLSALNPYGATKLWLEEIMRAMAAADPAWHFLLLRYFNPVGAHESGLMGEDPAGIPNNLMPYITQVAVGRLKELTIFGNDYPTPDGTGVRDYIHVCDLAEGHVAALAKVADLPGCTAINLGSGSGVSVAQLVASFEKAIGRPLPHRFGPRRPGDAAACYADASKALQLLGWTTQRDPDDMCRAAWNWQSKNPNGYKDAYARRQAAGRLARARRRGASRGRALVLALLALRGGRGAPRRGRHGLLGVQRRERLLRPHELRRADRSLQGGLRGPARIRRPRDRRRHGALPRPALRRLPPGACGVLPAVDARRRRAAAPRRDRRPAARRLSPAFLLVRGAIGPTGSSRVPSRRERRKRPPPPSALTKRPCRIHKLHLQTISPTVLRISLDRRPTGG